MPALPPGSLRSISASEDAPTASATAAKAARAKGKPEVTDGFSQSRTETVLVRSARSRRNAIDVAAQVLVGRLRPLQRQIDPQASFVAVFRQRERRFMH